MSQPRERNGLETATLLTIESAIEIMQRVRVALDDPRVTPYSQMLVSAAQMVDTALEMENDLAEQVKVPAEWPPERT